MSAFTRVSAVLEKADSQLFFKCPGCDMLHGVNVERDGPPRWGWSWCARIPIPPTSRSRCAPW